MSTYRIETGTFDEIEGVDRGFEDLLRSRAPQCTARSRLRIRLGLYELLVNIKRHAGGARNGTIVVEFAVDAERVSIGVCDGGRPFSGTLDVGVPSASATAGYGLPIIRAVFDEVGYERIDGRNHWTLTTQRGWRGS